MQSLLHVSLHVGMYVPVSKPTDMHAVSKAPIIQFYVPGRADNHE